MKINKLPRLTAYLSTLTLLLLPLLASGATKVFEVSCKAALSDHSRAIRSTIAKAGQWQRRHPADSVVVTLRSGAVYNLTRNGAETLPYYVSNTTSNDENPGNPIKHVGILFKGLTNLTFDGRGATLLTHGEMTPWVIDGCHNVKLCNLTIDAADPSVPEMTVTEVNDSSFVAQVNERASYTIDGDGKLAWRGEGWQFEGGIAQLFSPADSVTLRCASPVVDALRVEEISPGTLRFIYGKQPKVEKGISFQMRHSFRTEVAGLISESEDITLESLNLRFMGNFGIVAQVSSNITYRNLVCAPDTPQSGRHNAGFADFLQVSGCKGLVDIEGCRFAGAHDDPINIHGTHLAINSWDPGMKTLTVSYRHPQTFGFQSFFPGDSVEIVDSYTLLTVAKAVIERAEMIDPHQISLTLTEKAAATLASKKGLVVENITWCPSVKIANNDFTLTPTRGILISTRRPVVITGNRFSRIPMASILIADDGRSWYESGPVHDLVIADNQFIDCSAPQILISPENSIDHGTVHRNIRIIDNRFIFKAPITPFGESRAMIRARSVDGFTLERNEVSGPANVEINRILNLNNCTNITVDSF